MPYRSPRLLVLVHAQRGNSREMMEGLIAYSTQKEPIDFLFELNLGYLNKQHILRFFPDAQAYILEIYDRELIEALIATGKPVVMMFPYADPRVGVVCADDAAIGRLAFEHFASLGLKQFAVYQMPWAGAEFAHVRVAGFRRAAEKAGFKVHLSPDQPPIFSTPQDRPRLRTWLEGLPKPIGLFCMTVYPAWEAIRVCQEAEILVPDEVAVLGVDRDDLVCNLLTPKLSTIDTGAFRIGYEAARLALRMLRGRARPKKPIFIPPGELIIQQSTDTLAIDDPDLSAAVRFIRQHACQGIQVRDILTKVTMSRRALEMGFKRVLGRTVHEEIIRLRVEAAKKLLAETNLSILAASERSGFGSLSEFNKVFREKCGVIPRDYRQQNCRLTTLSI